MTFARFILDMTPEELDAFVIGIAVGAGCADPTLAALWSDGEKEEP